MKRSIWLSAVLLALASACPEPEAALRAYCAHHPDLCSPASSNDGGDADAGPPADGGPPPCAGAGSYCGDPAAGEDPNSVYLCMDGGIPPGSSQPCQFGCVEAGDGGDRCRGAPVCPANGWFCGSDGVTNGVANVLYTCPAAGQVATSEEPCAQGCNQEPPNTPDYCTGVPMCLSSLAGFYCWNDHVEGGTPNTLYHCSGVGEVNSVSGTTCTNGCQVNSPGTNDKCL